MSAQVVAIIPARMGSQRFPGKVSYRHRGKPLLFYAWDQTCKAKSIDRVVIATDSPEVRTVAESFGADVIMTSKKHRTGSDRCAEAMAGLTGSIFVNVQADTFGLPPAAFARTIEWMKGHSSRRYATLARRIADDSELFNPDRVKVVESRDRYALWFSRYPIPFVRDVARGSHAAQHRFLNHLGVYFFRRRALADFASWPQCASEKAESLEQLRILEHGERIRLFTTSARTVTVDSRQDVKAMDLLRK